MSNPFAMLVTASEPAPEGSAGRVLNGPMVGILPEPGAELWVRNSLSEAHVRYVGPVRIRRANAPSEAGILVSDNVALALLRPRALVCGSGARALAFKLQLRERREHLSAAVRYTLRSGSAWGLIRINGRLADAWVIDSQLSERFNLLDSFIAMETPEGVRVDRTELADATSYTTLAMTRVSPIRAVSRPFPSLGQIELAP